MEGKGLEGLRLAVKKQGEKLGLILDILSSRPKPKGIWSVEEAAGKLGLSQQHLRLLLSKGEVKGKKLGGTWVVLELSYNRKRREKDVMTIPQTWGETKEGKK